MLRSPGPRTLPKRWMLLIACSSPDRAAGGDGIDVDDLIAAHDMHLVDHVGDDAAVIGDDADDVAHFGLGGAAGDVDHAVLFGEVGDHGLGIFDHAAVILDVVLFAREDFGASIDDGAVRGG